jgi:hypothetical protein
MLLITFVSIFNLFSAHLDSFLPILSHNSVTFDDKELPSTGFDHDFE